MPTNGYQIFALFVNITIIFSNTNIFTHFDLCPQMKKLSSLLMIAVLMTTVIAPISTVSAQDTTDEEIADLLAELAGDDSLAGDVDAPAEEPAVDTTALEEPTEEIPVEANEPEPTAEGADMPKEEHDAAEDILDIESDSWKFAGEPDLQIRELDETSVVLATRVVTYDDAAVKQYKIYYSETPLSDALENFETIMSKDVVVMKTEDSMAEIKLDGLTENKLYYVLVAPIHPLDPTSDPLEMISPEVKFQTKAGAPVINQNTRLFESVSYTQSGNTVTVTWTPSTETEKGMLSIKKGDETDFTALSTVMMTAGEYTFTVSEPGTHYLLLHGVDSQGGILGQEQVNSIKVDPFENPIEPVISAPQVGPTTDLIMALIVLGFIVYVVYRFRRID